MIAICNISVLKRQNPNVVESRSDTFVSKNSMSFSQVFLFNSSGFFAGGLNPGSVESINGRLRGLPLHSQRGNSEQTDFTSIGRYTVFANGPPWCSRHQVLVRNISQREGEHHIPRQWPARLHSSLQRRLLEKHKRTTAMYLLESTIAIDAAGLKTPSSFFVASGDWTGPRFDWLDRGYDLFFYYDLELELNLP